MTSQNSWYNRKFVVIILIIVFFPVGLYGLWKSSAFTKKGKSIWTIILATLLIMGILTPPPPEQQSLPKIESIPPKKAQPESVVTKEEEEKRPEPTNDNPEPINVNVYIDQKVQSGSVFISGKINLPDETLLSVSLSRGLSYYASTKATVQNGSFSTEGFSHKGQPIRNGDYELKISTPIAKRQPDSVKKRIGDHGEYLRGDWVTKGAGIFKDDNLVKFKTNFIIENSVEAKDDTPNLLSYLKQYENHYAMLEGAMQVNSFTSLWFKNWNQDLSSIRKRFSNEFGSSSKEYKGECPQGFFNIAVSGGYMFNVWSEYNSLKSGRGKLQTFQDMQGYVAEHLETAHKELSRCQQQTVE